MATTWAPMSAQGQTAAAQTALIAAPPPITTGSTEDCDYTDGLILKVDRGGSVTGPVTMTHDRGRTTKPDGSVYIESEDRLDIQPGITITGPAAFCSRVKHTP